MDDFSEKINSYNDKCRQAAEQLDGWTVADIQEILPAHFDLKYPVDMIHQDIDVWQIVEIMKSHKLVTHTACVDFGEVELSDNDFSPQFLTEQTVKQKGVVWRLHKNDADPWPSTCHAHNYDTGEVIDLTNGNIYSKNRTFSRTLKPKKLSELKEKFGI